jgi:hypothetical protein
MTVNELLTKLKALCKDGVGQYEVRMIVEHETKGCQCEQSVSDTAVSKESQTVVLLPNGF